LVATCVKVAIAFALAWGTVRSLAFAWVLALPAAILLSGALYWTLRQPF
jgi:PiT family inorganic phosphate transporter